MPEAPEVDTDKLREAIDEEIEKQGATLLRTIALTRKRLVWVGSALLGRAGCGLFGWAFTL